MKEMSKMSQCHLNSAANFHTFSHDLSYCSTHSGQVLVHRTYVSIMCMFKTWGFFFFSKQIGWKHWRGRFESLQLVSCFQMMESIIAAFEVALIDSKRSLSFVHLSRNMHNSNRRFKDWPLCCRHRFGIVHVPWKAAEAWLMSQMEPIRDWFTSILRRPNLWIILVMKQKEKHEKDAVWRSSPDSPVYFR